MYQGRLGVVLIFWRESSKSAFLQSATSITRKNEGAVSRALEARYAVRVIETSCVVCFSEHTSKQASEVECRHFKSGASNSRSSEAGGLLLLDIALPSDRHTVALEKRIQVGVGGSDDLAHNRMLEQSLVDEHSQCKPVGLDLGNSLGKMSHN